MPSPSRIPLPSKMQNHLKRPAGLHVKKEGAAIKEQEKLQSDQLKSKVKPSSCKENSKGSKSSNKLIANHTAPESEAQNLQSKRKKQVKVADRRGISEIKRSEQNLQCHVETLEEELNGVRKQLKDSRVQTEKERSDYENLKQSADMLEKGISDLRSENLRLCEALEQTGFDAVSLKKHQSSEDLEKCLKSHNVNGLKQAEEILSLLGDVDAICSKFHQSVETQCFRAPD